MSDRHPWVATETSACGVRILSLLFRACMSSVQRLRLPAIHIEPWRLQLAIDLGASANSLLGVVVLQHGRRGFPLPHSSWPPAILPKPVLWTKCLLSTWGRRKPAQTPTVAKTPRIPLQKNYFAIDSDANQKGCLTNLHHLPKGPNWHLFCLQAIETWMGEAILLPISRLWNRVSNSFHLPFMQNSETCITIKDGTWDHNVIYL